MCETCASAGANYGTVKLEREDQAVELAGEPAKRDTHLQARDIWETMNGKRGDLLYAGEFEQ